MSAQKACGCDSIWIAFKFDVVVCWLNQEDLINFCEKNYKSKIDDRGYFEKMAAQKACERNIL